MLRILNETKIALISLFIMVLGSGFLTSLLPLRMHWANASTLFIGGLTTAYYAGLVVGSYSVERFIMRVGHIRAFAAFASLLAVVSMLHGFWLNAWFWIALRFIAGICTAVLYVVIESWLLAKSTLKTRGQVLGFYMIALYAAQSAGQLLLNVGNRTSLIPFIIAGMLATLSVVPLAMTKAVTPELSEPSTLRLKKLYHISPTGVVGCFVAGLILSGVYGLLPLYLGQHDFPVSRIATMLAITVLGGMLFQYPVGRLSDHFDRRVVLVFVSLFTVLSSFILMICISVDVFSLVLGSLFILGGASFTLYPLSISHACDHLESDDIVAGTQSLLLVYSVGATLGPVIAAFFMRPWLGTNGLIVYFALLSLLLGIFLLWRRTTSPAAPADSQQDFVNVPRTTPVAAELDPRGDEENLTN